MKEVESIYKCVPFWSWNDELDEEGLCKQIEWMHSQGVGGFFMHARGGLKTEYLGEKWFSCIKACGEKAKELGMEAYAYDENGWPSGFVGGKLLEDIENHDRYLTYSIGAYDEKSFVSYDISGDELKRTNGGDNCLNVYWHYSASTADILNPEVVDKFIALTHEKYKEGDTYGLKGFFTDEPQYFRWDMPYTKVLAPYYEQKYGEDLLDKLGLMFVEKKGYRALRYRYWKCMQELMLENFAKKIYDWCTEHGYKLTGHYVEEMSIGYQIVCCGGIMPFYEYEHIPGIDWLGRNIREELSPKQVGSVAAQLGKKQVISEMFACTGWNVPPIELKHIAEFMYVSGVNLMCQHLLPYTEHGQRKRDYPSHFSAVNPWIKKGFKSFNDYFSVLGKTLSQSEEIVSVAVLHPLRSAYFDYKRNTKEPDYGVLDIDSNMYQLIEDMGAKQIPHHYLDETLLAKYGSVKNGKLICGKCSYEYLVLPKTYTMDKTTEKLLREYVAQGGKVLLAYEKPSYLEGEEYSYDYLSSNVTWQEIIDNLDIVATENKNIRLTLRQDEQGNKFIFVVNLGDETEAEISVKGYKSFRAYDIFTDTEKIVGTKLHFDKYQSYLLYVSNEEPEENKKLSPLTLGGKFDLVSKVENCFTMDFAKYSFDGVNYSESLHHMGIFDEMLKKRYEGDLYLKYEFNVNAIPQNAKLLVEDRNLLSVSLNGVQLKKCGSSEVEKAVLEFDASGAIKNGVNEVVVKINYYQSETVYYALFGENVTESLKNCLAYDTDIEAIYLKGDFGVYGDFVQGKSEDILLGENFVIGEQRSSVTELIKEGFPFFAGEIKLKQTVVVDDVNKVLKFDKVFHIIDVKVNGEEVGRMMFSESIDLSKHLHVGENEIEINLVVGNRNKFGPFHTPLQEEYSVGPDTFERSGRWVNGKCADLRESYSFIKTIV